MNPRWLLSCWMPAIRMSAHIAWAKWKIIWIQCWICVLLDLRGAKKLDSFSKEINFISEFRMKETSLNGRFSRPQPMHQCKGANTTIARNKCTRHRCCDKIEVFEMISSIVHRSVCIVHTLLWLWCHFVIIFMPHFFFFLFIWFKTHCDHSLYLLAIMRKRVCVCVCWSIDRMSLFTTKRNKRMAIRKIIVRCAVVADVVCVLFGIGMFILCNNVAHLE